MAQSSKRATSVGSWNLSGSISLWARHTAYGRNVPLAKRIVGWVCLLAFWAFIFGLPIEIWCDWHGWDFCPVAHFFSFLMPIYWIYLAVRLKQRREFGEPLLQVSDEERMSQQTGWRAWRVALYRQTPVQKRADIFGRIVVLVVLACVFRRRVFYNGYFDFLCLELLGRAVLMYTRPRGFNDENIAVALAEAR